MIKIKVSQVPLKNIIPQRRKYFLNQKVIKKNSAYLSFGKDKKKQFKNLSKIKI
jgi:hypothetical protein